MKKGRYILEIYAPDNREHPAFGLESSTPFTAINVGDLLAPHAWDGSAKNTTRVRVSLVEHIFSSVGDNFTQITAVETTAK